MSVKMLCQGIPFKFYCKAPLYFIIFDLALSILTRENKKEHIMKAILQRVSNASVWVENKKISEIKKGWLILLGICLKDTEEQISYLGKKIMSLRAFCDSEGKMNLNVKEIGGSLLIVSQFTLYGKCDKGARPSFMEAARPELAEPLYEKFLDFMKEQKIPVSSGIFGATMEVHMQGDGPVTLTLESKD